jgi:cytochrome c biogenesis protein CcmG, thiol:disulfide interchange protein DsbE
VSSDARATNPGAQPRPRIRRLKLALRGLALLLAGGGVVLAVVLLHRPHRDSFPAGEGTGALNQQAPALDRAAPAFALRDLDGHVVRLSDLRGQVVLVNFWASWCVPCKDELPVIEQVYSEQHTQGFAALEVDEQESPSDVQKFLSQIGQIPPVLLDSDGSVLAQYRFKGLPDSIILDRQGTLRAVSYGPLTRDALLNDIETARSASAG